MHQSQHIFGSGVVFAAGIRVAWISYTQAPAEVLLFLRLIGSVFVVLAGWTFGKAVLGLSKAGSGISRSMFLNILPGLAVMLIYVFRAAKALGFYTATAIAFIILLSLYCPAPHSKTRTWVKTRADHRLLFCGHVRSLCAFAERLHTA